MKPQRIELHIDELVLHGFEHSDRHAIGEAIERELTRLLGAGSVPLQSSDQIDAGSLTLTSGARPQRIGTKVAGKIHRSLSRGGRP
jgi:hypothetical protein